MEKFIKLYAILWHNSIRRSKGQTSASMADVDVLVIGAGFAGLSAANRVADRGLSVLVLDAASEAMPNNSRVATGVLHVAFRHPGSTSASDLAAHLDAVLGAAPSTDLREVAAQTAEPVFRWLLSEGADVAEVDYGKGPLPILAPQRAFRAGLDWQGTGCERFLLRLHENLRRRGGALQFEQKVTSVVRQDDGFVAARADGEPIRSRIVLFADGGFQADTELCARFLTPAPDRTKVRAVNGGGDAIRFGQALGADLIGMANFYGHLQSIDALKRDDLWPYPNIDSVATAGLLVDRAGKRVGEAGDNAIWLTNLVARRADPLDCIAVCDDIAWTREVASDFVPPNPVLRELGATVYEADALETLAEFAGIDSDAFLVTAAVANATAPVRPPLVAPPFRAVPVCAGITSTMGGLRVDRSGRVLSGVDQNALPGIFAAGSCCGGYEGGLKAGYMGGLMKAFISGWLAGGAIEVAA
jgi:fumarate reductase flavoprotein subunit